MSSLFDEVGYQHLGNCGRVGFSTYQHIAYVVEDRRVLDIVHEMDNLAARFSFVIGRFTPVIRRGKQPPMLISRTYWIATLPARPGES